jgi:hypothetical protein
LPPGPRTGRRGYQRRAAYGPADSAEAEEEKLVPTPVLICLKAADGGLFVVLFAVLGEMLEPKRFAGIFGASPAVALANLLVIALAKGDAAARSAAIGMIAGAVALAVACAAAIPAVRRWGAVRGSALLWGVWILVGGAGAIPAAGGAGAIGTGLPTGHRILRRRREPGRTADRNGGRLFAVDLQSVREIRPSALAMRFAFGAAISVVAGLVTVVAGQRVGGVMLAAPAVLPATLTIIERQEGRGPAVTEVQGSVPGAVALIGFAVVAAATTAQLPLAGALLSALGTWIIAAIGGYLLQAAVMSSWQRDVRDLAIRRRDAARALRAQASSSTGRTSG